MLAPADKPWRVGCNHPDELHRRQPQYLGLGGAAHRRARVGRRVGVFVKNQFSRWVGVVVLAGNAIVQLMMIPAYPFWSLSIFALDILAIYGLIAYGKRIAES